MKKVVMFVRLLLFPVLSTLYHFSSSSLMGFDLFLGEFGCIRFNFNKSFLPSVNLS
ncbi:hypothetical protein ERO13_A10G066450v2 [Gossypium hirsutum]|uniref:Uncharacterized protein n=1 Tax=Gossypium darwinii TaxID=34276 RepID=A0A5D2EXM3_GOSDA|nr:hypothetical protein ERO13_A10G066450v2 [Gossypium hirsutum]TYG97921.1 hypothetical protein ES288_A10G076600v1 [Gossypium darwinii]